MFKNFPIELSGWDAKSYESINSAQNTFFTRRFYHKTTLAEMFTRFGSRTSTKNILKDIDRQAFKLKDRFQKMENDLGPNEIDELAEAVNSKNHFWRTLLNTDIVQEAKAATQIIGIVSGAGTGVITGIGVIQGGITKCLSDDHKKAVVSTLALSHVVIEQSDNNCYIYDYWRLDEQNRMFKLKTEVVPKPKWKTWLGL